MEEKQGVCMRCDCVDGWVGGWEEGRTGGVDSGNDSHHHTVERETHSHAVGALVGPVEVAVVA